MNVTNNQSEYLFLFEKKFKSLCKRSPVFLLSEILDTTLIVKDVYSDKIYSFSIDLSESISKEIRKILLFLRKNIYPSVIKKDYLTVEPSSKKLYTLLNQNLISFDEAFLQLSKQERKQLFVIDKINLRKNQIILIDEDETQFVYQMKMPVVSYLKNHVRGKNKIEAFDQLEQQSNLLYSIKRKK